MVRDLKDEHLIETFKSLFVFGQAAIKTSVLLNGGSAVALLTFVGNLWGKSPPVPNMVVPMACFIGGLTLSGFAGIFAYATQLTLFNEEMGRPHKQLRHTHWLLAAILCVMFGVIAFAIRAFEAMLALT